MIYKYYIQVFSDEHMLFASELAEVYGIYSLSDKPHYALVKTAITDYIDNNNIKHMPIFYETKKGLREVFPREYYEPALKSLLTNSEGVYISNKNKKYYFKNNI